ncbi:MAG: T9SS type A sorting domain-containing protein [Rhodothermales bacterium]|nr:T9SS type A sorting domain-containing protein [Rhodothermales bacterium]
MGGPTPASANVISGNANDGLEITFANGSETSVAWVVRNNLIGTNAAGTAGLGNPRGIFVQKGAHDNVFMENTIAYNGTGIYIGRVDGTFDPLRNQISENSIFSNTGLGIDLIPPGGQAGQNTDDAGDADAGPNNLQNSPVITLAEISVSGDLRVTYSVDSVSPNSTFPITAEFFEADAALQEGQTFVGSDSYTAPGTVVANLGQAASLGVVLGDRLIATATDADGNSSEFGTVGPAVTAEPVGTNATDQAALEALYNATNGAAWTDNTGWLTGDAATWFGVTVQNSRVTEINLNGNNLVGTLPASLGDLTALEVLNLGTNTISGGIPGTLGSIPTLRELHLYENDLTGAIPTALGNATALTTVRLYSNNLSGSIPSTLGGLPALALLNLDNNALTGSIPASFSGASALAFLSLSENQLTGVIPDLSATALTDLYVHGNLFSGAGPAVPTTIVNYVASSNAFDAIPNFSAGSYPGLALLNVEDNLLDFDDLLPNVGEPSVTYGYSPQGVFGEPQIKAAVEGTNRTLTAEISLADTYQWLKDGAALGGETSSSLLLTSVAQADAGIYTLQATNAALSLTLESDDISVSVAGDVTVPFGNVFETFVDGFERPEGLATDANGNILIADALTGTVRRFDETGAVAGPDPLISGLATPKDVTVGADGHVYVATSVGVQRVLPGVSTTVVGAPWLAGASSEVAFGPNGSLFISQSAGVVGERVLRVRPADLASGTSTVHLSFPDDANWDPEGIVWDSEGTQYVVARARNQILRVPAGQTTPINAATQAVAFTATSANGAAFGADRKLYFATPTAVLSGSADAAVLTPFVEGLGGDGYNQVAFDADGRLYVTDGATGRVVRVVAPQTQTQASVPVAFRINDQGLPGVTNGADFVALQSAFDAWTAVPTSSAEFPAGVPLTSVGTAGNDGTNVITFVDDTFPLAPGVLAVAAKTLTITSGDPDVAEIVDVDIVFNPLYVDNPGIKFGTSTSGGAIPIGAVAAHELGHALGLVHSGVLEATMWFALQPGNGALSLEYDDEARISQIYPGAGLNAYGSITGTIEDGENPGQKIAGALVTGTHTTSGVKVSAYTNLAGEYTLYRLTPGSWEVFVQPLDGDVEGFDLRPRNISAYHRAITHNTSFLAEFYTAGDSDSDSPTASTPVPVTAGSTTANINIVTNVDLDPPVVAGVFPAANATDVETTESILVTFSEEIDPGTLELSLLEGGTTEVSAGVILEPGGILAIMTPAEALRPSTSYTIQVSGDLTDLRGNQIAAAHTTTFTTAGPDAVSPEVAQVTPLNLATGVFITDVVTVRFSESMDPLSITTSSFSLSAAGVPIAGSISLPSGLDQTTAVFTPDGNLPEGTTITVSLTTDIKDATGNALAAPHVSSFTTVAVQAPSILDVGPADLTTGVAVETPVLVDFDEPILAASVTATAVVFSPPVSGTFDLLLEDSRLVFQPSSNLAFSTTYTVTVGAGITDLTGNPLTATEQITFTTAAAPALAPAILSVSPPSAGPGAQVTIAGTGFQPTPTANSVTFDGVSAEVVSASLTSLVVQVPTGSDVGDLLVQVGGLTSNAFPFFVVNVPPETGDEVKIGASESGPSDVEVGPDGVKALVTYPTSGKVQEIDLETTLSKGDVTVGDTPFKVVINPTGTRAYVTNFADHTVSVLDLTVSPPTIQATIPVGLNPTGIAVSPNGSKVFVAQKTSQSVSIIDANEASLAFNQPVDQIRLGSESGPEDVEAGPDGTKLYVGGLGGIYVIELDPTSPDFESVKHVSESGTEDVEVGPDGTQLFAVTKTGFIQIVDIDPNSATPYAVVNTSESGVERVEVGPDGTQLFATTSTGEVKVFAITYGVGTADAVTSLKPGLQLIESIPVGVSPQGIAVSPATGTIVVANSESAATEAVSVIEGVAAETSIDLPTDQPGPFTVVLDNADTVMLAANGVEVFRQPVADIGELRIDGTDGDDHLIIDLSGGSPTTNLLITFYGGDQGTEGDQLTVSGASSSDIEHVFYDEHSGQINVDGLGTINYFELEPVTDNMDAVNRVFSLSAGVSQTVTLSADGDGASGNGQSFIDSDNGSESITFANPTGTLAIVGDAGADVFRIGDLDTPAGTLTSLSVTGAAAADSFYVRPSALYPISVDGGTAAVCPGDVLTLDLAGIAGATLSMTGAGTGTWTFDAPHQPVSFTGIGSQPSSNADISLALSQGIAYTLDNSGLTLTVENAGTQAASCVRITIPDELVADLTGTSLVPSDGTLAGSPLVWTIPVMEGETTETLTITGLVSGIMPITYGLDLSVGGGSASSAGFTISPGFRFPAKAHVNTAIETTVNITVGGMPYSYNRLIVGLFQGSPGIDSSVWCSQPESIPTLFEPPGYIGFWRPCGEGLPHPLHANDLYEDDLGTLWLATWGHEGLYKSTDSGSTWEAVEPKLNAQSNGSTGWVNVYAITQDQAGVLYISANNGEVFRSLNGGDDWQKVGSLPNYSADTPWSLEGHPTRAGTVFAGTFGRGVFISDDFGFTWAPLGGDVLNDVLLAADAGHIFDLEVSPDDPDVLFAGTASGVFRGTPFAVTPSWTPMGPTVTLSGGSTVTPEIRTLSFIDDAGGDDDLVAGSWGFGVFTADDPLSATALTPLALREAYVSMLIPLADGGIFAITKEGGAHVLESGATSTSVSAETALPESFVLDQNYPNPFNPVTTIRFGMAESGFARLTVIDVLGRTVGTLLEGGLAAGYHEVQFDASGLPSGIYLYVLEGAHGRLTKRLILAK